jgi:hypothetical protein
VRNGTRCQILGKAVRVVVLRVTGLYWRVNTSPWLHPRTQPFSCYPWRRLSLCRSTRPHKMHASGETQAQLRYKDSNQERRLSHSNTVPWSGRRDDTVNIIPPPRPGSPSLGSALQPPSLAHHGPHAESRGPPGASQRQRLPRPACLGQLPVEQWQVACQSPRRPQASLPHDP